MKSLSVAALVVGSWLGFGGVALAQESALAPEVEPAAVADLFAPEAVEMSFGPSCGETLRASERGYGATCTAALQNLNAVLQIIMQDSCLGTAGVCGVGRLGVTVGCRAWPGGGFAIDGYRDFACYAF